MRIRLILVFITLICPLISIADNVKDAYLFQKVDYQQGLSNSAVLCLFQDNEGLMWFGTYDGVNCYDGKSMEVFRSDFSEQKTLSNNIIHSIQQADSSCLWITTHLGANRFSKDSRQVICNYEFDTDFVIHSNHAGNTWALSYDWIAYYNTHHRRFVRIPMPDIKMLKVDVRAFVTDEGELYLFPYESGDLYRFSLNSFDQDTLSTRLTTTPSHFHSKQIQYVCYQNGVFCFYDSDYDLFVYDISRKSKIYIRNIGEMVHKYGQITGIVPFYEDIVIAFQTNGLIRLRLSQKYAEEIIDQNMRIYGIYNDSRQGVLWVGTDGQGAIMYSKKYSIATNLMLNSFSPNLTRQVRSIMTDKYGGLWFGTKGDGLLHVKTIGTGYTHPTQRFTRWIKSRMRCRMSSRTGNFRYTPCWRAVIGMDSGLEPALRACAIILLIMESCMNFQIGKQELEEKWQKCIPSLRKVTVSFIWRLRVKVFIK